MNVLIIHVLVYMYNIIIIIITRIIGAAFMTESYMKYIMWHSMLCVCVCK